MNLLTKNYYTCNLQKKKSLIGIHLNRFLKILTGKDGSNQYLCLNWIKAETRTFYLEFFLHEQPIYNAKPYLFSCWHSMWDSFPHKKKSLPSICMYLAFSLILLIQVLFHSYPYKTNILFIYPYKVQNYIYIILKLEYSRIYPNLYFN